jgi:short-subunit dehydrogenase
MYKLKFKKYKMSKTILVTGASSGFGLMVANQLHKSGYTVIGTSRNPEKHQSYVPFKLLALDISDGNSISNFTKQLFNEVKKLDVLINNAGFYLSGLAEETTIEQGKQQFETNFPSAAYYSASKHALEGYFKALRFELNEFNIKVAMVEPTGFKTNVISNSISAERQIDDYSSYRKKVEAFAKDLFSKAPEATPVIDVLLKLVEEKNPKFNHPVGKGTSMLLGLQHFTYKTYEKAIIKTINKAIS